MDFKENTKKKRYTEKKPSKNTRKEAEGQRYLWNQSTIRYNIEVSTGYISTTEEPRFLYYSVNDEEYQKLSNGYKEEIKLLYNDEGKHYCNHKFIKISNKNREELDELVNSEEFEVFRDKFANLLYNLDDNKYPVIKWIINNCREKYPDKNWPEYLTYWNNEIMLIKKVITQIVEYNQDFKNFIQILHPRMSDYNIRSNYIGKSENGKENKSRKWRKNKEVARRRKERRDTKKSIEY